MSNDVPQLDSPSPTTSRAKAIGMHLLGTTRTDARVLREATALVHAGYTVYVVDTDPDVSQPCEERHQGIALRHVLPPRWLRSRRGRFWTLLKILWMLPVRVRALLDLKVDAYHAHDAETLLACYLAGQLRRKPVVLDAHELPYFGPYVEQRPFQRQFHIFLLKRMLTRVAATITVSPPLVGEMRQRYGGPPAVLVRNVPPYQPPVVSDRLRQHLGVDADTRIALYQGGLYSDRALDVLVRAAHALDPGILLVLMGNGPNKPELEALIQREQLFDRVKLLPAVPYHELLAWTASADLGLIIYLPSTSPNVRYCLPNKLFEYLMAGLPVLASSLDAVRELLIKHDAGAIVESLDPDGIGRSINQLIQDPLRLERLRQNALQASAADLNWGQEQAQLVGLYERVLGTRKSGLYYTVDAGTLEARLQHSAQGELPAVSAPMPEDRMPPGEGVNKNSAAMVHQADQSAMPSEAKRSATLE